MKLKQLAFPVSVIVVTLFLAGCQKTPNTVQETTAGSLEQGPTQAELEAARLQQCQKQLEALQALQPQQFKQYQQAFGRLMNGAAQYSGLRTQVTSVTQDTVDALYRYSVNKLCAQIDQAVLLGLTERGEPVK
ncbi:TPA: hypothetical protein ACSTNG_003624 [Serratia fonticola]|jgi:phage-related tail protein